MEAELSGAVEILRDRLYYVSLRTVPRNTAYALFFTVDNDLVYEPFFADFGPLNLGQLYRFCQILDRKINDPANAKKKIYFYSSHDAHKRANAAYLVSAYAVMCLGRTGEEAYRPFLGIYPPFIPFRDASFGICTYNVTVQDCLMGLHKALENKFIDFSTFNVEEYEYYEKVENGDLNWIVPGKFVAFSGPSNTRQETGDGFRTLIPEDYFAYFRKMNVTTIIRLNKKCYDRKRFVDAGFKHYDLYFVDGGTPSEAILKRFLEICETEPGAVAVHCKAGLGRTGTLIAAYIMKHFHFTASETIAYIRVCRPGSIIGPQQYYLKELEPRLWKMGEMQRKKLTPTQQPGAREAYDAPSVSTNPSLYPSPNKSTRPSSRPGSASGQQSRAPPAAVPTKPAVHAGPSAVRSSATSIYRSGSPQVARPQTPPSRSAGVPMSGLSASQARPITPTHQQPHPTMTSSSYSVPYGNRYAPAETRIAQQMANMRLSGSFDVVPRHSQPAASQMPTRASVGGYSIYGVPPSRPAAAHAPQPSSMYSAGAPPRRGVR